VGMLLILLNELIIIFAALYSIFLFLTPQNETEDAVVAASFSSNGYHVAVAYASGAVRVWDMRKSKMIAELNVSGDNLLQSVESLTFHPDGKYLAYGGQGGVHITMVKEWKVSAALDVQDATGVLWDNDWIASIGGSSRTVNFHSGET
jgi:WD40 repeat protein